MAAYAILYKVLWGIGEIFWVWMLVDCIMNEPEKYMWIWILLFTNIPGAVIYFILRNPVNFRPVLPDFIKGLMKGREINQAESDAYNVPNAHNYSKLGDIYLDTGNTKKAYEAYGKALESDTKDIRSLWGSSRIDMKNKDYGKAVKKLSLLLKLEPDYQYGDSSLAYGKSLFEINDLKNAKKHLEEYLKKHSHPEAKLILADIIAGEEKNEDAIKLLEEALMDIKGTPNFYYRKNRKWIGKIKELMRKCKK